MSFLDKIAPALDKAMSKHMRAGTLWRPTMTKDDYGNDIPSFTAYAVRGFPDNTTSSLINAGADAATVSQGDVLALILLHGLPIEPQEGDDFAFADPITRGRRFRVVRLLSIDPARATAQVEGRPA